MVAVAGGVLALAVPAPALATPAVPAPALPPQVAAAPAAAARAVAAPAIPCPAPPLPPAATRPPRPSPPPDDPAQRAVGGQALDTAGLVIPSGAPRPPAVTATSWLVADLDTGAVLGGCGPHEYATPASVQKLLLAATLVAKLDPKQIVTIIQPDLDFEAGSSAVGLLLGGRYSIETLWLGLLLNSGNDAANVLARLGGGPASVPGTVRAMNAEARRLGAYQTRAVTPSGLDGPGQFTSAYDLALIARACFANPTFRRYTRTERAQIPPQPPRDPRGFQIQNENQLVFRYPGALGGKTGFTNLARHTYVGAAARGGRRLVVTVLGAEARPLRGWQQGAALLDWGFALPRDATVGRLVTPDEVRQADPSAAPDAPAPAAAAPGNPVSTAAQPQAPPNLASWNTVAGGAGVLAVAIVLLRLRAVRRRALRRRAVARLGVDPAGRRADPPGRLRHQAGYRPDASGYGHRPDTAGHGHRPDTTGHWPSLADRRPNSAGRRPNPADRRSGGRRPNPADGRPGAAGRRPR